MPRCCNFDGGLGLVWCYGLVRGLPDLFLLGFINCVTQQNHYNEIRCLKQRQVRDLSVIVQFLHRQKSGAGFSTQNAKSSRCKSDLRVGVRSSAG